MGFGIKVSYDKSDKIQNVIQIVEDFLRQTNEMNKANTAEEMKEVLGNCEDKLNEFNKEKESFANERKIFEVLNNGTKILTQYGKNIADIIELSEEHEKKYGVNSEVAFELNAETCPAVKGIEECLSQLESWVKNLVAIYAKNGIKIEKTF